MVSWGYAFKRGLIIWLWTILWGIVGGIIALIISGGSLIAVVSNPSDSSTWTGAMAGVFAGGIIGSLIAAIGGFATIVKIVLESADETRKPPPP
jgi:hypothetical protein